jgi:hypothetical protein
MKFFYKTKAILLHSHHEKYLQAEKDKKSITQNRNGS